MPYAFCAKVARLGALPAVPVDGRRLLRGAKSILVGRRADCQRGFLRLVIRSDDHNRRNKRCHDLRQGFHHPGIPCVRPENDDQPACRIRHQGRARDHRQAVNRFGVPERGAF